MKKNVKLFNKILALTLWWVLISNIILTPAFADNSWNTTQTTQENSYNQKLNKIKAIIDTKLEWLLNEKLYTPLSIKYKDKLSDEIQVLKNIKQKLIKIWNDTQKELASYKKDDTYKLRLQLKQYLITKINDSIDTKVWVLEEQVVNNLLQQTTNDWKTLDTTLPPKPVKSKVVKPFTVVEQYTGSIPTTDNLFLTKIVFNKDLLWSWSLSLTSAKLKLQWLIDRSSIRDVYILDKNLRTIWWERNFNTDLEANINLWTYIKNNIINAKNNVIYLWVNVSPSQNNWIFTIDWTITTNSTKKDLQTINFKTNTLKVIDYKPQTLFIWWFNTQNTVNVWTTAELWQFIITAWWSNASSKKILLNTLILNNNWNSLEDNVKNIVLKDWNWNIVAKTVSIKWDKVVLKFNKDYLLNNWQTQTFTIYWDIVDWNYWDFIQFSLDNNRDLIWYEASNWNIPVEIRTNLNNPTFWKYTILPWKLTISKSNTSNTDTNLAIWKENKVLNFNIYSPQELTLSDFTPTLTITNWSNEELNVGQIFSALTLNSCDETYSNCKSDGTFDVNYNWIENTLEPWKTVSFPIKWYINSLKKWNNNFMITENTFTTLKPWVKFSLTVWNNSLEDVENSNWNIIKNTDINWIAQTASFSLVNPTIQISYNNPYWTLEYIKWWKNLSFWDIDINPSLSDVKLNSLPIQVSTSWTWKVNFSSVTAKLYVNWQLADTKTLNDNWTTSFIPNVTLPKDKVSKLEVKLDTDNSLYQGTTPLKLKMTVKNWITLISSNWIALNPFVSNSTDTVLESNIMTIYPTASLVFSNDNNISDSQILFWTDFNNVYSYKIKPKYDNAKINDLYVWLYSWNELATWNSIIWQIEYKSADKDSLSTIINWKSSFINLWDVYKKWEENLVNLNVKANKINSIWQDNKTYTLRLLNNWENISKYISMSNWEVINPANYIWNLFPSKTFTFRKSMINTISDMSSYNHDVSANNTEYTLYQTKITKLNKDNDNDLLKQFTLQTNVSNVKDWPIKLNNYKVEVSSNWQNWTDLTNEMEFQTVKEWDSFSWTKYNSNTNITESWSNTYLTTARFTWNYNNWYNFNNTLYIKVKATLDWFSKWDSISVWLTEDDWILSKKMTKYDDFAAWKWPYNALIWSDNANPNNTTINDTNWFGDYKTINSNTQFNILSDNN